MRLKILVITGTIVASLIIGCNKGESVESGNVIRTEKPASKDASLAARISSDPEWKEFVKIQATFLDKIVKSDIAPELFGKMTLQEISVKFKDSEQNLKEEFERVKSLASSIMTKYFPNEPVCNSCSEFTQGKIQAFEQKIILFRQNKASYKEFHNAIGFTSEETDPQNALVEPLPDCNNWRFYLCGTACALGAPLPPVFAACLLLCIAEFC